MAQALLAGADVLKCSACAICWVKIIRAPVPSVEKTLYYTLTLKSKFHLNLFQRYWWVKSVYIFWATLYNFICLQHNSTSIWYYLHKFRCNIVVCEWQNLSQSVIATYFVPIFHRLQENCCVISYNKLSVLSVLYYTLIHYAVLCKICGRRSYIILIKNPSIITIFW